MSFWPRVSITSGKSMTPTSGTAETQKRTYIAESRALLPLAAMLPTRNGPAAAITLPMLYVKPAPVPRRRREEFG